MRSLYVIKSGFSLEIQDMGRPGYLEQGLSRSGVADRFAMAEANALLDQKGNLATLEMCGRGGKFKAEGKIRIALTGAPMEVFLDNQRLTWNASHILPNGSILDIRSVKEGVFGYLSVGGGFETPILLGSRSSHRNANLGSKIIAGDILPIGKDDGTKTGLKLPYGDRFKGGKVRIVSSVQTELFSNKELRRFTETTFKRSNRGNRMGFALDFNGKGFATKGQLGILSDIIIPGDIQMTGDGKPYVLLPECQTTGGYPRIGTVIPADLPKIAQTATGYEIEFEFVSLEEAINIERNTITQLSNLTNNIDAVCRDPSTINDLLSYQLVDGFISAID